MSNFKRTRPIIGDKGNEIFKANPIVKYLVKKYSFSKIWDLYESGLASKSDMMDLYQLTGYSVVGFCEMFDFEESEVLDSQ